MKKIFFAFFIVLFSLNFQCIAQFSPTYSDAGMWNTLSINYALNKKLSIVFAEELRVKENYSRLNLLYTNLGLEYDINKNFKTSLVYRFIDKYSIEDRFSYRHRLMWDVVGKYKIKNWSFSYRHRLQVEYKNIYSSEMGYVPEWYSRHKVGIDYQLNKKLSTYFSTEMRYQLYDPSIVTSDHQWHRIRMQAGFDYNLNKYSKLGIYYLVQRVYNVTNRENIYITGLEYSINLKDSPLFKKNKKSNKK